MSHAGALMAAFTGAFWPGDRLGPEDLHHKCPDCQAANFDEVHMFCPSLRTSRDPMIIKTKNL
eukprot:10532313-Karenia_brevis.AAC.1